MKVIGKLWWLCLIGLITIWVYNPGLPEKSEILGVVIDSEPVQTEVKSEVLDYSMDGFDYKVRLLYEYELYGLVVSTYDSENWLDFTHANDPANIKDLCVVWGSNIESGIYREVKYRSGEFTCFYEWFYDLEEPFDGGKLSNNHIVPASGEIADLIRKVDIGDQIYIKGYLSNYEVYKDGEKKGGRGTSVIRGDSGDGACEVVYITEVEILKEANEWLEWSKLIAIWGLIITTVISLILLFTKKY